MYLARFEVGGEEWVQAAALVGDAGAPGASRLEAWDLIAAQLSAAARIPEATIAYRVTVGRTGTLSRTLAVTSSSRHERDIREVIARLTRVERLQGGTVCLPANREERDTWMERLGPLRLSATADGYSVNGVPLACDFRLSDALDELLTNACLAHDELSYQLHVRAAEVSPDWLRAARKGMLALRDMPGVRPPLVEWQDALGRALGHASAFCEEYLAVDSADTARSIEQWLEDRFRARYAPLGFPSPVFRFEPRAFEDPLLLGVHSHDLEPLSPVALCGVAESSEGRDRLLGWKPSARLLGLLARTTAARADDVEAGEAASPPGSLPEPATGNGPLVFVSYRHVDLARVARIVGMLQALGVPVWYDRGIPGGSEWDEVIEEHLTRARCVLVCASQAAIDSKWVRREVMFADALDIPILPVLLEDVVFRHGLGPLFTQYQRLDARATDFAQALRVAVAALR